MTVSRRAGGWTAKICMVSLAAVMAPVDALAASTSGSLAEWVEGPEKWLLLPDERKALKRIRDGSGAVAFVERFWKRRDRDGIEGSHRFREEFFERVNAADVLYEDEGVRGSLTDRGRALVLMGSPAHVTVATEPVMAWDPASQDEDRVTMRTVNIEIWGYRMEDLPPGMIDLLIQRKKASEDSLQLTLMFRTVGRKTLLVEGEGLLEVAARAAVVDLPED